MPEESIHDKLTRVRKPHVHLTYKVHTDGAEEVKELPFIVGIMGDYSGDPTKELKPFEERGFVEIDRDNINQVMAKMSPGLKFTVKNTLANDGSELPVNLEFNSMQDFEPGRVVEQVEPLKNLLEARNKLKQLSAKGDMQPELAKLLEGVMKNTEQLGELAGELGLDASPQSDSNDGSSEGGEA